MTGKAKWLVNGERCPASNTLYDYCLQISTPDIPAFPRDAAGLRRCRLLMETVPKVREGFARVALAGPEWAQFVSFWDDICLVQELEDPTWHAGVGVAKRTNVMIASFIEAANTKIKGEKKA